VLDDRFDTTPVTELRTISVAAPDEVSDLARVAEAIRQAGVAVDEIALRRPTLDDAFLALTGHAATREPDDTETASDPERTEVAA
jgi:ABC-2 type transport system ATP-binding protein